MEIEEVIAGLKGLDLSTYPEREIRDLMNNIGMIASMVVMYHPGKSVMRARPHSKEERFGLKSDLSFKPQRFNTTYQRASTPYQTMFYATAVPDKIPAGELDNMRIIGIAETVAIMRDLNKSGYQKISFGRWYVKDTLNLLAIVHKESYQKESSFTKELADAFTEASKNVPPEIVEKSLKIQSYLADEFSKEDIRGDYDYMISAIFTQIAVNKGYDGIFYPSVRVGGRGFNIAITENATEKLGLYVAGECSLYKIKDRSIVGNDAIVELDGNQDAFQLNELPSREQMILERLGLTSIEELENYDDN